MPEKSHIETAAELYQQKAREFAQRINMRNVHERWKVEDFQPMKRTDCKIRLPNSLLKEIAHWAQEKGVSVNSVIEDILFREIKRKTVAKHKLEDKKIKPNSLTNWIEKS